MGTFGVIAVVVLGIVCVAFLLKRSKGRAQASSGEEPTRPDRVEWAGQVNWLVGKSGPVAGKTFHIGYRTVTIGRSPSNYIQVEDEETSRKHCQVSPDDGCLHVVDMKSQNGTFLNGQPVMQGRLGPRDELRVGTATFTFQMSADHEQQDDAQVQKSTNPALADSTVGSSSPGLVPIVLAGLQAANWDVDATAENLGLSRDVLQKIIDENGLRQPPS